VEFAVALPLVPAAGRAFFDPRLIGGFVPSYSSHSVHSWFHRSLPSLTIFAAREETGDQFSTD